MNINFLRIPLHKLLYLERVDDFSGFSADDLQGLRNEYEPAELRGIVEAVTWATQNPDHDFASMLPDLRHTNAEIYRYLCALEVSLRDI